MKLLLVRHLWGTVGTWDDLFPQFATLGFGGVESPLPETALRPRFRGLLDAQQFEWIAQIFTAGEGVAQHVESFRRQIGEAAALKPCLINAHSGRDGWTQAESEQFFEQALAIEAQAGVPVAHETHRGRILFNPWITARLLADFPSLQLCCDFSHWVCVAERLLEDEAGLLRLSAGRCLHLHARVGYEQGPQVPDPRAPEYVAHLAAHECWWDWVWKAQAARGLPVSTLTPEFGPPGYQHTLPFTQAPVGNLWEICNWQARRQAERFEVWQRDNH